MPDLMDERAERIGITFLRNRKINPFPTAMLDNPQILEALFALTRPDKKTRKKRLRELIAEAAAKPQEPTEHIDLPKGMVQYRRELYGDRERPN